MHISKSLLPKGLRSSSPESDSGAPSLTSVAGSVPFSSDHIAEFQEGPLHPEREPFSSVWGDTSLSSPSKSDHNMKESPCHHQATTKKILQEKGIVKFFVVLLLLCLTSLTPHLYYIKMTFFLIIINLLSSHS